MVALQQEEPGWFDWGVRDRIRGYAFLGDEVEQRWWWYEVGLWWVEDEDGEYEVSVLFVSGQESL